LAYFAELNGDNIVTRIVIVDDKILVNKDGVEDENLGIQHCQFYFRASKSQLTKWKQTSYNGNIRKRYAGKGMTFDADRDAFIVPKPYPSWILNEETCAWEAPVSVPELTQEQIDAGSSYVWNEETTSWDLETL